MTKKSEKVNKYVENAKPKDATKKGQLYDSQSPLQHLAGVIAERDARYGTFQTYAAAVSQLERATLPILLTRSTPLPTHKEEALKMILRKIARILSGDPDYRDSWDDIAGYALLGAEPKRTADPV